MDNFIFTQRIKGLGLCDNDLCLEKADTISDDGEAIYCTCSKCASLIPNGVVIGNLK